MEKLVTLPNGNSVDPECVVAIDTDYQGDYVGIVVRLNKGELVSAAAFKSGDKDGDRKANQ